METGRRPRRDHQPELPLDALRSRPSVRAVDWQLDDRTCRIGRAGVAAARAALQGPTRRSPSTGPSTTGRDAAPSPGPAEGAEAA